MEGIVHQHNSQSHVDPWASSGSRKGPSTRSPHFAFTTLADELLPYQFPGECQEELLAKMQPLSRRGGLLHRCERLTPNVFEEISTGHSQPGSPP